MTVKDLKQMIANLPDDGEIKAEDKISGDVLPFDLIMSAWTHENNLIIGLR